MPSAIVFVVNALAVSGAISVATAVAIGSFVATYGAAILLIGGLAYSSSKARQAKEDARNAYNAAQVDRLTNVSSTIAPRELVMGRVRKGGAVFYKGTTGAYQQDMYLAIALAGHEIDAVEAIYLNDELVTLDAFGNVTSAPYGMTRTVTGFVNVVAGQTSITLPPEYIPGSVSAMMPGITSSEGDVPVALASTGTLGLFLFSAASRGMLVSYQYRVAESAVQITKHLGTPGQVADPSLRAAFPADWSSSNTVQGVAYLVVRLRYSETAFPNGAPNVTAVIRGAKLYDPRTGLTAWTENPALMLRHVYQHPKFGKATITAAEDARIVVAANACETYTMYPLNGDYYGHALYRAALVLPFGTATRSGFDDLAQAMGGSWAFAGGELYCKAGVYTAPVMSLGDADLAVIQRDGAAETQRPIAINVHKERAQKFNTVKVKMWDQGQDYKEVSLTPLTGAALLARDGAELVQEVTFPAIGYAPQALHVAGVMMRDARDSLAIELPFSLRAYSLELFDNVSLTLSRYGWVNKTFSILGRTWNADGTLQLSLKETSASITQVDAAFPAQGFASNTNLPKPWIVADVGALTITSGTSELVVQQDGTVQSRMRVSWTQIADAAVEQSGQIEVQYRLASSDGAWASLVAPGDETQVVTSSVTDGAIYIIRARAKTKLAVGDWNVQQQHQVIGKTEPPPYVDRFKLIEQPGGIKQFFWQMDNKPADLFAYQVRYSLGTIKREWNSMIPLFAKDAIATSHENQEPANDGTYTFAIRGVDTSGILSSTPHYITEVLDGDVFGPVKLLVLPQELDWPGVKTSCAIDGTELGAVGTLAWSDFNVSWATAGATEWRNTSPASIQYAHPVIDTGSSIARTIRASALVGGALVIEYAHSTDGVTYSEWGAVPTAPMTSRYFKFRWTVSGSFPRIYRAQVVFY